MRAGVEEGFRDDDGGGAAIGGGAALEFGEGIVNHGCVEDLVEGVDGLELGVGVLGGVGVIDTGDFGKVVGGGAVSDGLLKLGANVEGTHTSPYTPGQRFRTFVLRQEHW